MILDESTVETDGILVLSDFDGTACQIDLGNSFLSAFAAEGWQEIDRSYSAREVGSRFAYQQVAALIRAPKEEMIRHARSYGRLDPYFPEFYRFCLQAGLDLKIVSDGLDFYIAEVLKANELTDIQYYCNYTKFIDGDRMLVEFPDSILSCRRCGTCKTGIIKKYRRFYRRIIYIGDGYSDFCAANEADLLFAKDILLKNCQSNGIACIPFTNFRDIESHLRETEALKQTIS